MLSYIRNRGRAVSLVCALSLGACQTLGYDGPLTADEELLRTQSEGFVAENVAALSVAANNNGSGAGTACAIGAAGGAVVGGVDGYMKAKEAQTKANDTAMTAAMAEDVRADNEKLAEMVETSRRVVENDRRRLDDIARKVDSKILTLEQARAEAAVIRNNSQQIETILQEAREKRDTYQDARSRVGGGDTAQLDAEIGRLNGEISQLETQLSAVNTALRVNGLG